MFVCFEKRERERERERERALETVRAETSHLTQVYENRGPPMYIDPQKMDPRRMRPQ